MAEPLTVSKLRARERRWSFRAKASALAGNVGLPTMPYRKTGFPLPAWASFYADDSTLAVLVCPGEQWRTVEKALAYGVAHANGRKLELVIPEHWQVKGIRCRPRWSAPLSFAPTSKSGRTTARPREPRGLLDPGEASRLLQEECAARRGTRPEGPCMAGHRPGELGRQPAGPHRLPREIPPDLALPGPDPAEHPAQGQGPAGEIRRPLLEAVPR